MASTPQWMRSYLIHGHNGYQGSEREPHVQVNVGGNTASVSLRTCQYIVGGSNIPHNYQKDVLEWVRDHRSELMREWEEKSNPYGY